MRIFNDFCIVLLRVYQRIISPGLIFLGVRCRFEPSCSHYGISAIKNHGIIFGNILILWRLLRCNPLFKGGYDPVPSELRFFWRPIKNG